MISALGSDNKIDISSRLAVMDLPEPGTPNIKPFPLSKALRLTNIGFFDMTLTP